MFEIRIWCEDVTRIDAIKRIISTYDTFRVIEENRHCDVLIVDLSNVSYQLPALMEILEKLNGKTILILLVENSNQLLDIMGLYVYQYILYEQLEKRLPSCLNSIAFYLMNVSTICIHQQKEKRFVRIKEIYDIVYEEGIVYIEGKDRKLPTQYTSLEKVRVQLDEDFLFVNRNTIIHTAMVSSIQDSSVTLSNGHVFPLSRRRKKALLKHCEKGR